MSALQRMIESVVAGADVPVTGIVFCLWLEVINTAELTLVLPDMEALRTIIISLKARLADGLSEVCISCMTIFI